VDTDKNAQEAAQWKKKYLDYLEESERKERQWNDAEELLRKTITRLTLAADGLDETLDRQLRELRNAIRDRVSTAQLGSRVDDMSKTLVRLDKQRKKREQDSAANPLLDLLDALPLPKGTGRQTKALKKQLQSASQVDDPSAIQSFAELIRLAIELSSDESSLSSTPGARTGLLKRFFGAEDPKQTAESGASGCRHSYRSRAV
jgi:diguanylate cyclase